MFLILVGAVYLWSDGSPKGGLSEEFRRFGRRAFEDVPVLGRVPYALLVMFVTSAALASDHLLYGAAFAAQVVFYGLAAYGAVLDRREREDPTPAAQGQHIGEACVTSMHGGSDA